jgi:hypothetical protein
MVFKPGCKPIFNSIKGRFDNFRTGPKGARRLGVHPKSHRNNGHPAQRQSHSPIGIYAHPSAQGGRWPVAACTRCKPSDHTELDPTVFRMSGLNCHQTARPYGRAGPTGSTLPVWGDAWKVWNRGRSPFGALSLSFWRIRSSRCRVRPLATGQTPTEWDDQIAVAAHMRT